MTNIIPWRRRVDSMLDKSPFEDMFSRLLSESFLPTSFQAFEKDWLPSTDVSETENEYHFSMELPGMDEKEVKIQLVGDTLVVTGERKEEKEKKGKRFHRTERTYGSFRREFTLPGGARKDPESIHARFKKGMLEITIDKLSPEPTKEIPVRGE